jgi:hypothetical protein
VHGPAIIAQQRAEWEQSEREQGRGRRGPYWRPVEARMDTVRLADTLTGRERWLEPSDPLTKRLLWRDSPSAFANHSLVLAHLRERVALPG